jgi:hypothetical protein
MGRGGNPSPLAGEGGRRPDEGEPTHSIVGAGERHGESTPHPPASPAPSPARGEGNGARRKSFSPCGGWEWGAAEILLPLRGKGMGRGGNPSPLAGEGNGARRKSFSPCGGREWGAAEILLPLREKVAEGRMRGNRRPRSSAPLSFSRYGPRRPDLSPPLGTGCSLHRGVDLRRDRRRDRADTTTGPAVRPYPEGGARRADRTTTGEPADAGLITPPLLDVQRHTRVPGRDGPGDKRMSGAGVRPRGRRSRTPEAHPSGNFLPDSRQN